MTQSPEAGYIQFKDVSLAYGRGDSQTVVFEKLNFRVEAGESVAIIGPSGCGKTSILHILSGLLKPTGGEVLVDGAPVVKPRRDVALMLQDAGLLPWKTVWQNAILGLQLADESFYHALHPLKDLGIEDLMHRYPAELSGGQRQRVGIARALVTDPSLMLMDEPLASLDTFTKEHIQSLFLELWIKRQHTQVMVTHDLEEAVFLSQRILVMSTKPAKIQTEIHNPSIKDPNWRKSDAFYDKVIELRKALA